MQKASVPGSPGCLEHSSMIWLGPVNPYGSVLHALIEYAMDVFWIPERVKDYEMKYTKPAERSGPGIAFSEKGRATTYMCFHG